MSVRTSQLSVLKIIACVDKSRGTAFFGDIYGSNANTMQQLSAFHIDGEDCCLSPA